MAGSPVSTRRETLKALDITPRQREVLDLLAQRKTNAQIAETLGISLDGAKWHVSEIITRLGVDSREEAAELWRQHNGARARFGRFVHAAVAVSLARRIAIGAGVAAAVAAIVVGALVLGRGGDEAATPDSTPTPVSETPGASVESTASASATAAETAGPLQSIAGVPVRELQIGNEVPIPAGAILYFNQTCYRCGGGINMQRAYIDAAGETVIEPVLEGDVLSVFQLAILNNGALMVLQYCSDGFCGLEGGFEPGATQHTATSTDGGRTWEPWLPGLPLGTLVLGPADDGWFVMTYSADWASVRTWLYPSDETIEPPVENATPFWSETQGLYWYLPNDAYTGGTYFDAEGREFLPAPEIDDSVDEHLMHESPGGTRYLSAVDKRGYSLDGAAGGYLVSLSDNGEVEHAFLWPGRPPVYVVEEIGEDLVIGNALYPNGMPDRQTGDADNSDYRAVLVDLENGTVHSIRDLPRNFESGNVFSYPHEFVRGGKAVLRVATGGDCLNVREGPSTEAAAVRCYVDDVLLFERETAETPPEGWVAVRTPDGREGFASTDFLVR